MNASDASQLVGRRVLSAPASGAWNMALDQALLESAQADETPVLRLYRWKEPTLSLGYFQHLGQRQNHLASQHLTLVRRSTGGGAIVHDNELTYSISLPTNHRGGGAAIDIYQLVHQAITDALLTFGVQLQRHADLPKPTPSQPVSDNMNVVKQPDASPFLCFQRRTDEDLILSGYKVVGSAQRRSAGALLQHGSILLAASRWAPELPGIQELVGKSVDATNLQTELTRRLAQRLDISWNDWGVTELTKISARKAEERFLSKDWNSKRP